MDEYQTTPNLFQKFIALFRKKPIPVEDEQPTISIIRPDIRFRTLDAFKKQGVFFINLDTGEYIKGIIDLTSIGLTFTPPQEEEEEQRELGFHALAKPKATSPTDKDDYFELEAILFFEYEGPECETRFLEKELAFLFFLKVWDDRELRNWEIIVENVVNDLTFIVDDYRHPMVKFVISTTFVPNDLTKKSSFHISKKQPECSPESSDAISHKVIDTDDDIYEDHLIRKPVFPRRPFF